MIFPRLSILGEGQWAGALPSSAELHGKSCSCHHHGAAQLAEERNPSPKFHSRELPILGSVFGQESGACVCGGALWAARQLEPSPRHSCGELSYSASKITFFCGSLI